MIFLPDTNVFSSYLAGRSESLTERMRSEVADGTLRLSFMVIAELEIGAEKARVQLGTGKFARRVDLYGGSSRSIRPARSFRGATPRCAVSSKKSVARSATVIRSSPHMRSPSGPYWSPGMATSFRGSLGWRWRIGRWAN